MNISQQLTGNKYFDNNVDLSEWQELHLHSLWQGLEDAFEHIGYTKECALVDLLGE